MIFKKATILSVNAVSLDGRELPQKQPIGLFDRHSCGFMPELLLAGGYELVMFEVETKTVPKAVIDKALKERLGGKKFTKAEKLNIRDSIETELLKVAFPRTASIPVALSPLQNGSRFLIIGGKTEDVIATLTDVWLGTGGAIAITPPDLTDWVREAPDGIAIGDAASLLTDDGGKVSLANLDIEDEVDSMQLYGAEVSSLAFNYRDMFDGKMNSEGVFASLKFPKTSDEDKNDLAASLVIEVSALVDFAQEHCVFDER